MAYLSALLMVVVAEMGDKTQLIAMAFASRYRASHVLWGVLIGSLLNHGIAVMVGTYLGEVLPLGAISVSAGALFLLFGVMALKPDKPEDDQDEPARFGPIATVALSFFLGEMADKTQLTTLTLSVEHRAPLLVLLGAVTGMMVANSPGIFLGEVLFRKLNPRLIRMGSAGVFLIFGAATLVESLGAGLWTALLIGTAVLAAGAMLWRGSLQRSRIATTRRAA